MSYPIEIEIDDPHAEVIDEILTEFEHSIMDIRDRWEKTADRIVHTADLHELLADQNAVAFVWDIQHVKDQRPDLCDEQAWAILQECLGRHDRLNDPMLETIRQVADKLYPQQRQVRSSKPTVIITVKGGLVQEVNSTKSVTVFVEDWDCPPDQPLVMDFDSEPLTPEQLKRVRERLEENDELPKAKEA
jgi:hypothetical protein